MMKPNPRLPVALIVTTDADTGFFLRKVLQLSFQLIERDTTDSAQETLDYTSPNLVLLDAKDIEEETLFPLLSRFRKTLDKKTPILLITNNLKRKFAQDALRAGASDFINRPLDEDEIEQRIAIAFQSFEQTQHISTIAQRSTPQIPTTTPSLKSRKFLNDEAMKELSKARESGEPISLLMIEPAKANEKIPAELTSILQDNLRRLDILIPQSPGKYILMLPKTSERAAELICKTLQEDIEQKLFPFSISIGLITWDRSQAAHGSVADEFDHLIKAASSAVARAKKAGQ